MYESDSKPWGNQKVFVFSCCLRKQIQNLRIYPEYFCGSHIFFSEFQIFARIEKKSGYQKIPFDNSESDCKNPETGPGQSKNRPLYELIFKVPIFW